MFSPDVTIAVGDDPRPKVVPATAFAERARQLFRDRAITSQEVLATFEAYGWTVEEFGPVQAGRIAAQVKNDSVWNKHSRDAMIAGHVEEMDEFWTANPKDFIAVGLDPRHIVDIKSRNVLGAVTPADRAR